ncbi:TRAP transporter permease [Numidum massiliense]|uniref:TRAP transporter permease n=1 Tax=Numidum massiliense TaxID=1522315 RepID=UPI0006D5815A|nr:TRAP transporter permease [Numidum massiliense]
MAENKQEHVVPDANKDTEGNVNPQALLEKYDRESGYRKQIGKWSWVVMFLAVYLTLFHLYTGYRGVFQTQIQGAIHVGTALGLIFLLYPAKKGWQQKQKGVPWYDVLLAFSAIFVGYYKILYFDEILAARTQDYPLQAIIVAIVGVLLLLEATRRTVGIPIVVVASIAILYTLLGNYIPTEILSHQGFTFDKIMTDLWFRENGVFGTPVQISAKFIFLFLFFGTVLVRSGIGQFFNDIAFAATGRFTGGTAKAAVIASAFQGMISGSSVGNTVASGSFTIPMMKKAGFKPEFAAATEASASTGGQLMPPIMGAAAFIMVEYLNVTYSAIMLAAAIPAVLYFSGIFIGTHLEAKKQGVIGLPKHMLPSLKELALKKGYLILPLIIIILTLLSGFTAQKAALMGIVTAFAVSLLKKETRMSLRATIAMFEEGARIALPVIAAVGCAGIIAGVVGITGLGNKFASGIIALANGQLILALVFTAIACLVLGMGLPTTANYVVTATVAAPALINEFGVAPMAVHLFVFYFGIIADITPPVCLAAYAGAGIARANPFQSGVMAVKLAIAAFIVPFAFVYNPMIVLVDVDGWIVWSLLTTAVGMTAISSSVIGYFIRISHGWERIVMFGAGLMFIAKDLYTDLIALLLVAVIWFIQKRRKPDVPTVAAQQQVSM